jgi:hypothetical protein
MHNVLQQCQDEYNAALNDGFFTESTDQYMNKVADELSGYPIVYNNDGCLCNGVLVFMIFNATNQEVLPLHKAVANDMLDDIYLVVKNDDAVILSEIILGENKLNIEQDISELENYQHYYDCLVEDGVLSSSFLAKCKSWLLG